jgi:hypothetical protein
LDTFFSKSHPKIADVAEPPPLTVAATRAVIARLGELTDEIVLVGGQAVAFWADYYHARESVAAVGPVNSRDIDFCGPSQAALRCAAKLGGRAKVPEPFSSTPNTGVVEFTDPDGVSRVIDFLAHPFGLDYAEVVDKAIKVRLLDDQNQPTPLHMLVMHPMHCLESRVHNVARLPGYDTPRALAQLRAAILCVREYLRDRLDANAIRAVLDYNERVYKVAAFDRNAIVVYERHHIDPFDAVLVDERLPEKFHTMRLPQMRQKLADRRHASGA